LRESFFCVPNSLALFSSLLSFCRKSCYNYKKKHNVMAGNIIKLSFRNPLLHRPLPSPTPQNLRHRQTDVMNLYIGLGDFFFKSSNSSWNSKLVPSSSHTSRIQMKFCHKFFTFSISFLCKVHILLPQTIMSLSKCGWIKSL
jgi:hypothetical protein